eukprot:366472-Chlamydomonas_euryale.AAC.3
MIGQAQCTRQPYLPHVGDTSFLDSPEAAHLDRQFRLLREDFIQPLRDNMALLRSKALSEPGIANPIQVTGSVFQQRNVFRVVAVTGIEMKPRPSLMLQIQLPPNHGAFNLKNSKDRQAFWNEFGKGTLPLDALVCVMPTQPINGENIPLMYATVSRRDENDLAQQAPCFGLHFAKSNTHVNSLMKLIGAGPPPGLLLLQVSTSYFSVFPLLNALKDMTAVPLADAIVHGQSSSVEDGVPRDVVDEEVAASKLDQSQQHAMRHALTKSVALIQGPPGTGKTHVGALVTDAILRRTPQRVLCVCYTNHALDQFLESLLDKGIKTSDIVRIGSQSKSQKLAESNLWEIIRQEPLQSNPARHVMWQLMERCKEAETQVDRLETHLAFLHPDVYWKAIKTEKTPYCAGLWYLLNDDLPSVAPNAWRQFKMLPNNRGWRAWLEGQPKPVKTNTGGLKEPKSSKQSKRSWQSVEHQIIVKMSRNDTANVVDDDDPEDIWTFSPDARLALASAWLCQLQNE